MKKYFRSFLIVLTIILLSLFGSEFLNIITELLSRSTLKILLIILVTAFVWQLIKKFPPKKIFVIILVVVLFSQVLLAEELLHVLLFGGLGVVAREDKLKYGLLIGVSVSVGDEILQWILPYRVGDIKDVILNIACFLLGYYSTKIVKA